MTVDTEINAVSRPPRQGSVTWRSVINGRDTVEFDVFSAGGAYRPAPSDDVVLKVNSSPIFGGIAQRVGESGAKGEPIDDIVSRVIAASYAIYLDRRFVDESFPAGTTLKEVLEALESYLTPYGASLDAGQAPGPTFTTPLEFKTEVMASVINQLTTLTDFHFRINGSKVWGMYQAGVTAAPIDIIDGVTKHTHDIKVNRFEGQFINRVIAVVGISGFIDIVENYVGNGTDDTFPVTLPIDGPFPYILDGASGYGVVDIFGTESLGAGPTAPQIWQYDRAAKTITRTTGAVPNGEAFSLRYQTQGPYRLVIEDTTSVANDGPWETVISFPHTTLISQVQALAEAIIAKRLLVRTELEFDTREAGLEVGQVFTATIANRAVNDDFVISEIAARSEEQGLRFTVKAVDVTSFTSFRDVYRAWLGGGTSGSASSVSAAAPGTGGLLQRAILQLTDAQVKAAADTPVLIVPDPGTAKRIKLIAASFRLDTSGGAYGNVDADARLDLIAGGKRMSMGWYNDSGAGVTALTDLMTAAHDKVGDFPVPAMLVDTHVLGEDAAVMATAAQVENEGLYLFFDNGGSGAFTGGNAANGMRVTVYYVIEDTGISTVVPSACTTTLWSDDFESGTSLSADYTVSGGMVKTAGEGVGASQAIDSNGAFLAEIQKTFTPNSRLGCITLNIRALAALHAGDGGGFGSYMIEVHDPTGPNGLTAFGLSSGGDQEAGTDFGDIFIYDESFTKLGSHADEALVDDVYAEVRVEFELSSLVGSTPQADAWIKVYVDNVLVIDLSGQTISTYHATNNPNNYWGGVRFAPQGYGDELLVRN